MTDDEDDEDEDDHNDDDNEDDAYYREIFLHDTPLLDVRAPVEFLKGAFPTSVNVPILDDEQRHLVGSCYKQRGPEAARKLGEELLTPALRRDRLAAWQTFTDAHPGGNSRLYCFRGGSRSRLTHTALQQHLRGADDCPQLVRGGYKAMRRYLLTQLEDWVPTLNVVMLGGRTGSGKTHLLDRLARHGDKGGVVDLEGLARHRGSAFGALPDDPQPTQINFENAVAIQFLQQHARLDHSNHDEHNPGDRPIFLEEEGRRIGRLTVPSGLSHAMAERYPVVELETAMEDRVDLCLRDYVTDDLPRFLAQYPDDAAQAYAALRAARLGSLARIKNRVPHYEVVLAQVTKASDAFERSGGRDTAGFRAPTEAMLRYYDKMYDYQMTQRKGELLFRGDAEAVVQWAASDEGRRRLSRRPEHFNA